MDTKPSRIEFDYNGKHFCLQYTRETVKMMEAAGYNPSEAGSRPLIETEQLWAGAFLANHRKESQTVIKKMYDEMSKRDELLDILRDMIAETYMSLISDEGNVEWTATP